MGLKKEPFEVDFFVDPKPLTKAEKRMISDYIKVDKEKRKRRKSLKKKAHTHNN